MRRLSASATALLATALVAGGVVASAGTASAAPATTAPTAAAPSAPAGTNGWSSLVGRLPATRGGTQLNTALGTARAYHLTASALTTALAGAPVENTKVAAGTLPVISIPGTDGALHRFTYVNSPVMEPGLAAKVAFQSYAATAVDEPGTTARFDYSPAIGFHATVRSPKGSWNVDPAYRNDTATYLAHQGDFTSTTPAEKAIDADVKTQAKSVKVTPRALPAAGDVVTQRIYRMALANNPGYAALVGVANVDTIKAALVNRVNEIYNDDMAIKFVLINNNNLLDFNTQAAYTGANGPCGVSACYTATATDDLSNCGPVIDQNVSVFDKVVGNANFDIGHILALDGTGGVAIQGAGTEAEKAAGCSGAGDGKSDFLAVEFFAHELGHQLGASHTFSSASCGGYNLPTAVEIGSGSSIMSYAGTCAGTDNIQQYSDPYFDQVSIKQMQTYVNSTIDPSDNDGQPAENGGSSTVTTSNHNPVVTVPGTVVIPVRTPFTLAGTVTDADSGQVPVNVWEQNDTGTIRPLQDNNKTDGPLFRTFSQAATPSDYETTLDSHGTSEATAAGSTRTFPDLAQIAAGNTDAASGTCPTANPDDQDEKECFAEFLPTSARTLHFDLTARDRYVSGGGVTTAETVVTVAGTTPFAVTDPASTSLVGKSNFAVTWNVAGTTAAPFNVANVKISYSTDGGLTFPTVLAASTPNDGTQSIVVPNTATTTGRFKVEAIGQPFFDISHTNLTVTPATAVTALSPTSGPAAGGTTVTITGNGFTGTTAVKFGSFAATSYTVVSDTTITAVAPAEPAGAHYVTVTSPTGTTGTVAAALYTFTAAPPAPTVTAISPSTGPNTGGTTVTLTGTNFTGATAVSFGAVAATSFTVVSNTTITAKSPAQAASVRYITVTTPSGVSAKVSATLFTYVVVPAVTALSPTSGPNTGGTTVTVTGSGFTGATAVTFGAVAATSFTVVSDTKITAKSPAQASSVRYITVTTPNGTSAKITAAQFTYAVIPTVTAISPTSGPTAGGTTVTVTGSGFTGATAISFGAVAATTYTVVSDTKITVTSPGQAASARYITVTTPNGTSAKVSAAIFTYGSGA